MLEVIGFHFYCICTEVTPPEGWSKLGLSRFTLIYTAHQAESSHKIVRNSNTNKQENMKFWLRNISFCTELKLGIQLSKRSIYRMERVDFYVRDVGSVTEIACELVENVSFEQVEFRAPCDFEILLLNLICPLFYRHLCIICELNNEPIRGCRKTRT
jgi:hypothetical protein